MSLGIDVGGGSMKAVVLSGRTVVERVRIDAPGPFEVMLPKLVGSVGGRHEIDGIGVGLAGLVDHASAHFVWGPHLADPGIDVAELLAHSVDTVVVDNDANLAAHAEALAGAAAGHRVSLTVSVGTGIGAGLVVDGRIHHGRAYAGEVGHMQMIPDGHLCVCGRYGCWETLVSGQFLSAISAELGYGDSAEDLVQAADEGRESAKASLERAGRWLGVGIGNLVLALDPSVVVLAGGVSDAGGYIIDPANAYLSQALPGAAHRPAVRVVRSRFGRWAAAVGASLLAAPGVALVDWGDTVGDVIVDV